MKNKGYITNQEYLDNFEFKEKTYNRYLIKLKGCDDYYTINRLDTLEQALIGGTILFETKFENQIQKYNIISYGNYKYELVELGELNKLYEMLKYYKEKYFELKYEDR